MPTTGPLLRKLLLTAFTLVAVAVAVLDYFVTRYVAEREVAHVQERLAIDADILLPQLRREPGLNLQTWADHSSRAARARITLIRADGKVVVDSEENAERMENHGAREEVKAAIGGKTGTAIRRSATLDRDFCYLAVPVSQGGEVAVLRLAVLIEEVNQSTSAVRRRLAYVSFAILAAGLGLSFVLSRRFAGRVRRLQDFAEGVLERKGAGPIEADTLDELGSLGQSLNRMAGELGRTLQALEREAKSRDTMLTSMEEGVLLVDSELQATFGNPAFAKAIGAHYPLPAGASLRDLVKDRVLPDLLAGVRNSGAPVHQRLVLEGREQRAFQVHAVPFGEGAGPGVLAIFHDITDLEKLERVRKDFVSNVSHELRTPLASIQGYAETLLDGALDHPETARRFVETIRSNSIRLNDIAADLLSLAQLDAGNAAAAELISVRGAVQNAARVVENEAKARQVTLSVGEGGDVAVLASRLRLEQAIINLLTNAVKFNQPGGRVDVTFARQGEDLEIRIQDTGIGIPPNDLPRIFERFYRVDKARSREVGGTGLGLSIVKHSVESMGGRVRAESEQGKGSAFTVTLPIPED